MQLTSSSPRTVHYTQQPHSNKQKVRQWVAHWESGTGKRGMHKMVRNNCS
jgi:hypothetical protein